MRTFQTRFWTLIGVTSTLLVGSIGLAALATYKPYGVPDLYREKWDQKQLEIKAAVEASKTAHQSLREAEKQNLPLPLAFVKEPQFDFGLLDPGGQAEHTFVIENRGDAPLVISMGNTSCKCTLSKSSRELIPPGESADVTLLWNTGEDREFYRQYAVILTNDPRRREIELAITGRVKAELAFDGEEIEAPNVQPDNGARGEIILYSQTFDDFEIEAVEGDLPGFLYSVEPVADERIAELSAKSAWRLLVSTDASLPSGAFSSSLRVSVRPTMASAEPLEASETAIEPASEAIVREITFRGFVHSSLAFYGATLDSRSGLDMGIISSSKGAEHNLFVRARGNSVPNALKISGIEPKELQATIEPVNSKPGLFALKIFIPKGSPQVIFNRDQQHGYVEVCDVDNPNNKKWLPIHGAVIDL